MTISEMIDFFKHQATQYGEHTEVIFDKSICGHFFDEYGPELEVVQTKTTKSDGQEGWYTCRAIEIRLKDLEEFGDAA